MRFFLEIKDGNKISLAAFWKDMLFKCKHADDFNKVALVTDIQWFRSFADFKDNLVDLDIRAFDNDERLQALNWIAE
ncbi:STAS/SEC14 domain-containing protein [Zunongwangia sp. HGR-M22]|uniref:STAS/SEC14 domain-containing protein n=1 Tax=Zunongwangia sp. HGR-M22 TaxID=3015168 RepID=UPI002FD57605